MFGKGVYFANCPLKSWQYCFVPGLMLVCNVELGHSRLTHGAWSSINPDRDLKRGWWGRIFGRQDYDSITASDGPIGCVRVPEFVVYRPEQAAPVYVLKVREVPRRAG